MRRRLTVVAATAAMMATMVASAGMASAAPCGSCGGPPPGSAPLSKGAEKANAKASFGIATAIQNSTKNDECTGCNPL